jgi:hypothetical protein
MLKKSLLMGAICLLVVVIFQNPAEAISRSFSTWGASTGSLFIDLTGEGPGNYTKWPGQVTVTIYPKYAAALCTNPTKKKWPNRLGTPYFWEGEIVKDQSDTEWKIEKNGAFEATFIFTYTDIFGEDTTCPEGACDTNAKWDCAYDENGEPILILIEFNIRLELKTSTSNCDWFTDHEIGAKCTLNDDLLTYSCTTTCDDFLVCYDIDLDWPDGCI